MYTIKNIFTEEVAQEMVGRINTLTPESERQWGKMNVGQMLVHCNGVYGSILSDEDQPKPNFITKFMIKMFAKEIVTGDKPYKQNNPTSPQFIIKDERDFEKEKALLIANIHEVQALGEDHFDNKESHSFGKLSVNQWNNMFYKHLDHHLSQFGA